MRPTLLVIAHLFAAACCQAGPYTDLVVFGDSLSDVGNTSFWTAGLVPGADNFEGRFSNGPVYAESLSQGLGLGALTRDGQGGGGFGYGGAETNGPGGFAGLFLNSLVEQVDAYLDRLGGAAADPDALHAVFIGANDLLGGQTNVTTPAGVVESQLERLVAAGARQFLGVNLPDIGLTPDRQGNSAISARTSAYNDALEGAYRRIERSSPDVTIHRLDVESLFDDLIADPTNWGFTNVTDRGQDVPGSSLDRALGYLFWDGVHPTSEAHALLGEAAIRAVLPAGDYDRDDLVTASDYLAWSDRFGVAFDAAAGVTPSLGPDANGDGRVDAADYTVWRDRSIAASGISAPEPSTAFVLLAAAFTPLSRRDLG